MAKYLLFPLESWSETDVVDRVLKVTEFQFQVLVLSNNFRELFLALIKVLNFSLFVCCSGMIV